MNLEHALGASNMVYGHRTCSMGYRTCSMDHRTRSIFHSICSMAIENARWTLNMHHKAFLHLFWTIFNVAKPLKMHCTCVTFQKKYAFRCSVVTSMCAPPMRNHYFFFTFLNVPRVLHTFFGAKNLGNTEH